MPSFYCMFWHLFRQKKTIMSRWWMMETVMNVLLIKFPCICYFVFSRSRRRHVVCVSDISAFETSWLLKASQAFPLLRLRQYEIFAAGFMSLGCCWYPNRHLKLMDRALTKICINYIAYCVLRSNIMLAWFWTLLTFVISLQHLLSSNRIQPAG